jgi:hypothetical protein
MMSVHTLIQALEAYAERAGARVLHSALPDCVHGRLFSDHILVGSGLSPHQELSALVHEVAHWLVHRDARPGVDCTLFEYEAEAVEALVMHQLGFGGTATATDSLLSASVERVRCARTRICEALGLAVRTSPSEAQAAVDLQAAAGEEIVFEYEQYGMGDFLGLPEAL